MIGGFRVKLSSLEIKELYGCYDYKVSFNSDVTFLYGTNGCGKTTILNITEAIITGQLFKLYNYHFSKIILYYFSPNNSHDKKVIKIISNGSDLNVLFNNTDYSFSPIEMNDNLSLYKNTSEIAHYYFNKYDFLIEIRRTFNYVYLPLNRSYNLPSDSDDIYRYRFHNKPYFDEDISLGVSYRDTAMERIESLIYANYSKISNNINKINDNFRNNILKSQIEIKKEFDIKNFLIEVGNNNSSDLKKTKFAYIKILKELNLINKSEEEEYSKFFDSFIKDFEKFKEKRENDVDGTITINLLLQFQEITKMKKTIKIAEIMENQKANVRKPLEIFLNTMNSFIKNNDDEKELCINNDGHVYFKTKYNNKISIHHLSSGEKQLITFFANLIFNVDSKRSGIFVVDEPELSLHLSWQKIFIDKILEIDKDIQLIFATHAPEIVGNRRSKMFKLKKIYTGVLE